MEEEKQLKVVLLDDEKPALREMAYQLKKYPRVAVVRQETNPLVLLDEIGTIRPDVVFMDIQMPQLQGMDAAVQIQRASPATQLVFVTAYQQYAVEAFEINACDYLLKPIQEDRMDRTIARLLDRRATGLRTAGGQLQICCFGHFQIGWQGEEPIKWRTEKTRELFAYLLLNNQRFITKDELLDRLWPDEDQEKSIRQLYNGIYYIRRTLGTAGIDRSLISIDQDYNIKLGPVVWDVQEFIDLSRQDTRPELVTQMTSLYRGDLLEAEGYEWAYQEREKLAGLYERCLYLAAQNHCRMQQYDQALALLEIAFRRNPYAEQVSELIVRACARAGQRARAARHYQGYTELLHRELGVRPDKSLAEMLD